MQSSRYSDFGMDKLQRGSRKWPRRVELNDGVEKRISLPPVPSAHHPYRWRTKTNFFKNRSSASEKNVASSKEERCINVKRHKESSRKMNEDEKNVCPRLLIALSSKEKEEDFAIMKGCKPSQRPKKRAKSIQNTILLMSPGAWLTDVCRERYQVREKTCKKKPSGLKAMQGMEGDWSEGRA